MKVMSTYSSDDCPCLLGPSERPRTSQREPPSRLNIDCDFEDSPSEVYAHSDRENCRRGKQAITFGAVLFIHGWDDMIFEHIGQHFINIIDPGLN